MKRWTDLQTQLYEHQCSINKLRVGSILGLYQIYHYIYSIYGHHERAEVYYRGTRPCSSTHKDTAVILMQTIANHRSHPLPYFWAILRADSMYQTKTVHPAYTPRRYLCCQATLGSMDMLLLFISFGLPLSFMTLGTAYKSCWNPPSFWQFCS